MCHCGLKSSKGFGNTNQSCSFLRVFLHMFWTQERVLSLYIFVKNHDTQTKTGKFILTLHCKQLFLNAIYREATKVLYTYLQKHLPANIFC